MLEGQKQQWAEEHARRIQKRFEQWQQPLGINGQEYAEYLRIELIQCCDDPLLKELIESMSQ
jgi:DNA-binding transcriptional regulator YbjK